MHKLTGRGAKRPQNGNEDDQTDIQQEGRGANRLEEECPGNKTSHK